MEKYEHKEEYMLGRQVYFSKVSLNSGHVYELQQDFQIQRARITDTILAYLTDGFSFTVFEGENPVDYTFRLISKDNEYIHGIIDREAKVFVKKRDESSGEMYSRSVPSTEEIEFLYDVFHEYVGFITRQKFGYNMFNIAFARMLNEVMKANKLDYSFYLELYNYGLTYDEIKTAIFEDEDIMELAMTYRPANPDEEIIDAITNHIDGLAETGATEKTVLYKTRGGQVINGKAKLIQEDFKKMAELNNAIDMVEQTKRGYFVVTSKNANGAIKSTVENRPFIKEITTNLVNTVIDGIREILGR